MRWMAGLAAGEAGRDNVAPSGRRPTPWTAGLAARPVYFDYANVLVFLLAGMGFVFANLLLGALVRPRRKTADGLEAYECGERAIGEAWFRFDIRYYTVALVYIVFAVEIAFLFPWARVLKAAYEEEGIGAAALWEGLLFVAILFLGLAYVWARGDLDWVKTYEVERGKRSA